MEPTLAALVSGFVASIGITSVKQENWPDWAKLALPYVIAVAASVLLGVPLDLDNPDPTLMAGPGAAAVTYSVTKNGRIEAALQSIVSLLWKGPPRPPTTP